MALTEARKKYLYSEKNIARMRKLGKRNKNGVNSPMYGKHFSEESKKKMRLKLSLYSKEASQRMKQMNLIRNPMRDPKSIAKHSKIMKEHWKNLEFRERVIKAQLKGMFKRPTSLERQFIDFFQKYNLPYKYVGDGEFIIGGKCPDFINVNGKKICVEVRNRKVCKYYDKITPEEYEKERKEHFAKYGWKCIVLFFDNRNTRCIESEKDMIEILRGGKNC